MDQNISCVPPPDNWLQMGKIQKVFQIAKNVEKMDEILFGNFDTPP